MIDVRIVHELPRRVRLRSPQLVRQRAACERIAAALLEDERHDQVTIRPTTGSVVVEGRGLDARAIQARLAALLQAERDDQGRSLAEPRPAQDGSDRLSKAILTAAQTINAQLVEALDGEADLATLSATVLGVMGAAEVVIKQKLPAPPWSSLLWYSVQVIAGFKRQTAGSAPR